MTDDAPTDMRLFDDACILGYAKLGEGWIDDLYRASLMGGSTAAGAFVEQVPEAQRDWGAGDLTKAVRLTELWSAVAALTLLQREPDQVAVVQDLSEGFSSAIFTSDPDALKWFLTLWRAQADCDGIVRERGGIPLMQPSLLYWRSLELLGRDLRLRELPFPAETLHDVWLQAQSDGIEVSELPVDIVGVTICMDLWLAAARTANEQLQRSSES